FEQTITTGFMTVSALCADCTCTKFPSYSLAINSYRYVARVVKKKSSKYAEVHELDLALILILREVQRHHFEPFIASVDSEYNIIIEQDCKFSNLAAHRDPDVLLRLMTRINQTVDFSYDEVHPVLLPAHCHFSR